MSSTEQVTAAHALHSVVSLKVAFPELNPLFCFLLIVADVLRSMLQQLDRQTFSTDALILEQNEQLAEGGKLIQSHQAAIERLEKRTKVQEQQVKKRTGAAR